MTSESRMLWASLSAFLLLSGLFVWGTMYRRLNTFSAGSRPSIAEERPPTLPVIRASDPRLGSTSFGAVELIEFADYRCLHCRAMAPDLLSLLNDSSKNVRLVWREAPTQDQSREGLLPFLSGRCAHRQGKFAALHPQLFAQASFTEASLITLAETQGLDTVRFQACLNDTALLESIKRDQAAALDAGITSSPTIFVKGQPYVGRLERAELNSFVE